MNSALEESKQRHPSDQSWWECWAVLGFCLRLKHCYHIILLPCALFSPTLSCESERKSWLRRWGHFADGEVMTECSYRSPGLVCSMPSLVGKHMRSQQARVVCKAVVQAFASPCYLPWKQCSCWCFTEQMVSFACHVVVKWNGLLMKEVGEFHIQLGIGERDRDTVYHT